MYPFPSGVSAKTTCGQSIEYPLIALRRLINAFRARGDGLDVGKLKRRSWSLLTLK
jgi:hypothetical protein